MYENWLCLFAAGFQEELRCSDLKCCHDQKEHTKTLMDESSIPWIRRVIHPGCFREIPSLPVFLLYFTVPLWRPLREPSTVSSTPWKINMEPTNHPFRKENNLPKPPWGHVPCESSGVYSYRVSTYSLGMTDMTDMTGCLAGTRGGQCHGDMWGSWCLQQWGSSGSWSEILKKPWLTKKHFRYTKLPFLKGSYCTFSKQASFWVSMLVFRSVL